MFFRIIPRHRRRFNVGRKRRLYSGSVHQFFANDRKLSNIPLKLSLESHVTPLDMVNSKDYLETNSGLENTWPRLEICLTSRAIRKTQDLLRYFIQVLELNIRLILFNVKAVASLLLVTVTQKYLCLVPDTDFNIQTHSFFYKSMI